MHALTRYFLLFLLVGQVLRAEAQDFDASASLSGTYLYSGGNNAETVFYGPSAGIGYQLSEPLHFRADFQHTQGRLLYDGLGGIAKQSMTGVSPGLSWDILESLNLDAEYTFRLGENSYAEHEGALALEYFGFNWVRFGGDASYSTRDYVFPTTGRAIGANTSALALDVTATPASWIELPVTASYVRSEFSTNNTPYSIYSASGGLTLILAERKLRIGAAFSPGFDSSNYTLLAGDLRIGYKVNEHVSFRGYASITTYSFTSSATAKGKRQSGNAVNPLGNSDTFDIILVGLATSYNF